MEISTMNILTHWRCSAILSVGKWTKHGGSEVLQLWLLKSQADEKMVILRKAQAFGIHKKLINKSLMLKIVYIDQAILISTVETRISYGPHPYAYLALFPDPTQLSITCSTASDRKLGGPRKCGLSIPTAHNSHIPQKLLRASAAAVPVGRWCPAQEGSPSQSHLQSGL